ncbi:MAG TPA: cation transporter, partial [Marinobacter sp.]|nr:cation transporter [Marinobacter sp.]
HDHSHADHENDSHHSHDHHDHNRRAAYLHVLADALTSVLAIVALLAGKYAGWNWMDPAMGIVGAILITRWSWGLLQATSSVLLDQQQTAIEQDIKRVVECGDTRLSDLHVWSIGPNLYAAIAAVVTHNPQSPGHYRDRIRTNNSSLVHVTVEVETCPLDSELF